ncbi:putative Acyl-protein thioesterase 1 [Hypsibius exemplaris]|uniref:palmitoyl-protein hydrolase n=1 Tax=Hypsibius exemplaris TaxID=2072580 RepID=A0A9X6NDA9_HYPEX|nr:putative Acyl-protein thioesterase 1 [Hypsibius exemplaris]
MTDPDITDLCFLLCKFDLYGLQIGGWEDQEGIKRAAKEIVSELIAQEESAGIKSDRIVVGGFSQGGALALYSALTLDKPLAGAMSLSSWLPIASDFPKALSVNKNIPILVCHGDSDTVVTPQVGLRSRTRMAEFAPNITSKIYRGVGHSSSQEEMMDVRDFIRKCLPNL